MRSKFLCISHPSPLFISKLKPMVFDWAADFTPVPIIFNFVCLDGIS